MGLRHSHNKSHVGANVQTPLSSFADDKVKVTVADTTSGYLNGKIVPGVGIYTSVLNPGADEDLQIDSMKSFPLADGANIAVDASLGNIATVTLGGNRQLDNPTNPASWQMIMFIITQDGAGNRLLTFDTDYVFGTTLPSPLLSTGGGDRDYLGFIYHPTDTKWHYIAEAFGL